MASPVDRQATVKKRLKRPWQISWERAHDRHGSHKPLVSLSLAVIQALRLAGTEAVPVFPELSALAFRSATAVQTAVRLASEKLPFQEVSPHKLPHEPRDNSPQPTNAPTGPPSVRGRVFAATDPSPASPGYLDPPRAQRRSSTDTPAHLPAVPPAPDASPHRPVPSSDGPDPARRRKTALAQDVRYASIADGTAAPTAR